MKRKVKCKEIEKRNQEKVKFIIKKTYAIFSDGDLHGTSSSNSSSLSSPSSPSSLPDILNDDDVNISGTGKIDGRLLPKEEEEEKTFKFIPIKIWNWNHF